MSFVAELNRLPFGELLSLARGADGGAARAALNQPVLALADFARLLSPAAGTLLEEISRKSQGLTRQRFGRVIRMFAPLYLSNECINNCSYCGFSRDHPIYRVTLSVDEVEREGRALHDQGFRSVLLVAGEHPKFVSEDYLETCVRRLAPAFSSIAIEVGPMETEPYERLVHAGAEGLVVYQETYDRNVYQEVHTAGQKKDFDWRLSTPERAYSAGFRRLGIGALLGLADWRLEAIAVAAHAAWLLRQCWKAQVTVSLPRLRPHAGEFQPLTRITDREFTQLVCALRLFLPDVGLVLSTRESARLRDGLIPLGITMISAGSHTEPGGYTGAGKEKLHRTERGKLVPLKGEERGDFGATSQFEISDHRSAEEMAAIIRRLGCEPVWKDWDAAISGSGNPSRDHVLLQNS
jgi:2-iminoacetate synthase